MYIKIIIPLLVVSCLLIKPTNSLEEKLVYYAKKNGLDPKLVRIVAEKESSMNPRAVSHAGAIGTLQLMPIAAKHYCQITNPRKIVDIDTNLSCGTYILKYLIEKEGSIREALISYNSGEWSGPKVRKAVNKEYAQPILDEYKKR